MDTSSDPSLGGYQVQISAGVPAILTVCSSSRLVVLKLWFAKVIVVDDMFCLGKPQKLCSDDYLFVCQTPIILRYYFSFCLSFTSLKT
jgi:hypothetical protein